MSFDEFLEWSIREERWFWRIPGIPALLVFAANVWFRVQCWKFNRKFDYMCREWVKRQSQRGEE